MNRKVLRRGLAWCVVALVLVPLALAVVLGLGGLLAALGDEAGAAACSRVSRALGVLLVVVALATTAANALAFLLPPRRRRRRRRAPPPERLTGAP